MLEKMKAENSLSKKTVEVYGGESGLLEFRPAPEFIEETEAVT